MNGKMEEIILKTKFYGKSSKIYTTWGGPSLKKNLGGYMIVFPLMWKKRGASTMINKAVFRLPGGCRDRPLSELSGAGLPASRTALCSVSTLRRSVSSSAFRRSSSRRISSSRPRSASSPGHSAGDSAFLGGGGEELISTLESKL